MPRESGFPGILIEPNEVVNGAARWPGATYAVQKHQFFDRTVASLRRIAQEPLGAELLGLIGKRFEGTGTKASGAARSVTIVFRPVDVNQGASAAALGVNDRFSVTKTFGGRQIFVAGQGSASKIRMHNQPESNQIYSDLAGVPTPTWIALAHELIHAYHHLSGTTYRETVQSPGGEVSREEMFTTGLGPYANTRLSENKIRASAGLPARPYYTFVNDHTHMTSLMQRLAQPKPGFWYCACLQEQFGI